MSTLRSIQISLFTSIENIYHHLKVETMLSYVGRNCDDFRKTPYRRSNLLDDIETKLLKLKKNMKLEFGAADLIRTPDDEFVFLEINPNGRWWWIQELTRTNIARDIAMHLSIEKT